MLNVTQKLQSFYPGLKNATLTLNIHASPKTTPVAGLIIIFSLTAAACIVLLPIAGFEKLSLCPLTRPYLILTFILLMWRIGWAPNSVSKWQMEFNSAFKGLKWIKEIRKECLDWIFNWCRTRSRNKISEYLSVEYWENSLAQCKMKMDPGESEWIMNWTN